MIGMRKLSLFCRRQLHTIVSREVIKPSSPTSSQLKTYNLSLLDQLSPHTYFPLVTFYPNSYANSSSHVKILDLKNSLSQTLTQYYPFAGRFAQTNPTLVDCNDYGVEFLEACNDSPLSSFLENMEDSDLNQLFPNGLVWNKSNHQGYTVENDQVSPLMVQVNHFKCGGLAIAVSLSHKIADGSSLCNFFNDWATVTRSRSWEKKLASPINPHFIIFQSMNLNVQQLSLEKSLDNSVTRSFVFPNSKIDNLKHNVIAMTKESGQPIMNPTRAEVVNWLLYKCAVVADAKNNSGFYSPTGLNFAINIRKKMESLPEKSVGNFSMLVDFPTKNLSETMPSSFMSQLRKRKMDVQAIRNIESTNELILHMTLEAGIKEIQRKLDDYFFCTSLCWYPLYGIDFGWGNPVKVTFAGAIKNNTFVLMDTINRDGIKARVTLNRTNMEIFQRDPELLQFATLSM